MNNFDPAYQQTWALFQQQMLQQRQQQMMMQYQFQMYQQFCFMRGLDPTNQNSFNLFYQQMNQPMNIPQQPQQTQYPQQQIPQQTSTQQSGGDVYVGENLKELLPRTEQTLYVNKENMYSPNMINVAFRASTGFTVIVTVSPNITVLELFKLYMDRVGLPYKHLGQDIQFLFNGKKIEPNSNKKISEEGFKNNVNVVVFDQGGVIGAF